MPNLAPGSQRVLALAGEAFTSFVYLDNILRSLESPRTELVWLNTYLVGRLLWKEGYLARFPLGTGQALPTKHPLHRKQVCHSERVPDPDVRRK